MQHPNDVASKSVGENASPLPLLSIGASVRMVLLDCKCVDSVRRFPWYTIFDVFIVLMVGINVFCFVYL
jgi:hypothetical protein